MILPKHIFFDLDHTLWDFDANAKITFEYLFRRYKLYLKDAINPEDFYPVYQDINQNLWAEYRKDRIDAGTLRINRFLQSFAEFGIEEEDWIHAFAEEYTYECPKMGQLNPGAKEILEYLQMKYSIHIITNGFQDVQSTKIEFSGISSYINTLITSFDAKSKKPDPEIFNYALAITGAKSEESVIIGDDYETDIEGGYNYGISVIFYNLKNKPNPLKVPEVSHLDQLRNLL